jgi:hypothetical protein
MEANTSANPSRHMRKGSRPTSSMAPGVDLTVLRRRLMTQGRRKNKSRGRNLSPRGVYDPICYRPCLAQLISSFFTNLSKSSAKQLASAAAYQFSCFSEYTKSSQQAEAAFHQLIR